MKRKLKKTPQPPRINGIQSRIVESTGINKGTVSRIFNGKQKLPFVAKAGRIAGAVNLPTAQVFEKYPPGEHLETCCYTFKEVNALKNMATGVVGGDLNREIIVYCDSGRVASSDVLTQRTPNETTRSAAEAVAEANASAAAKTNRRLSFMRQSPAGG